MLKSRALWITLALLVSLPVVYFWAALSWSYSSGERAGWVQKFSDKGWLCKTWEGELVLQSLPGAAPEKFAFTVRDPAVAKQIKQAMGERVSLQYEQKVGLPTSCFGDTRYYATGLTLSEQVPLAAGVMVPTHRASAASR